MDPRIETENWREVFGEVRDGREEGHAWSVYRDGPAVFSMQPPGTEGDPKVTRADIAEVLHFFEEGENDGGSSLGDWDGALVGLLSDGRYVAAHGWCDYSGWG